MSKAGGKNYNVRQTKKKKNRQIFRATKTRKEFAASKLFKTAFTVVRCRLTIIDNEKLDKFPNAKER